MDSHKPIHLLVDGDITYHRAARRKHEDGTQHNFAEASAGIREHYTWLQEYLGADRMTVVLSGASHDNFRKELYAPYKGDRPTERPPILDELKGFLHTEYTCAQVPLLEADDVMGIMSSDPQTEETRIVVTIDKDLMQIPGRIFNPSKWQDGVITVTRESGDLKFYEQWMTGDATDCYPGCPGVGPKKAEKLIADARLMHAELEELVPFTKLLEEAILALYFKHGLTYDYAITQARLARILRFGEYQGGSINLWAPQK